MSEHSDSVNQHERRDFQRIDINSGLAQEGEGPEVLPGVSYQSDPNEDPTIIYALLDKRPQIYSGAIDTNSLVAQKKTVTPIMHFNPCNR